VDPPGSRQHPSHPGISFLQQDRGRDQDVSRAREDAAGFGTGRVAVGQLAISGIIFSNAYCLYIFQDFASCGSIIGQFLLSD